MVGESTTIDSILIEVRTDSADAARGIDNLATALGKLKKNGAFKTVSTNLENLSKALNGLPNVHSASNALRTLANSIERLKGVGSVASLSNSLSKLPSALKGVGNVDLTRARTEIASLADALEPLTQLKASGFSSMVNAMSKIEKVTDSLDAEKIEKFAEKVKELNRVIEPFATKMGTIAVAFKGLDTAIKHTNVSIDKANAKVNVNMFNFANLATTLEPLISAFRTIAQGFANIIGSATQWDGIAARFGKGFGAQAQETYEWIQRLNEEMGINVQQFMQYSSVYATMLTGFGVAQEDASKMALGYTELTYDIWAGYNDIYRTFDEAAEAVRSAIAGEVEPVRRAGFTIIESTLQQTAANHGLSISLETATEAQKSYLRYLTLVDQAHSQSLVGTYAKEMNTAEGLMRTLSQQLKSLAQAFGSLFIPMLVKALPYVQAFVELLTEGVHWLANIFGIDMPKVDFSGYEAGAGAIENVTNSGDEAKDALEGATKAAKELKNATLGIDELNVISPPSASGGSGSGSGAGGAGGSGFDGMDIDSLWDESIFDTVQSKVDDIKNKLSGMFDDWLPTIKTIGALLAGWGIASLLDQMGKALQLGDDFHGKITSVKKLLGSAIIVALQFKLMDDAFSDFMGENGTILDYIEGILIGAGASYLLWKQWGTGGLAIGLGVTAAVSLKSVIDNGGITDWESATVALTGLAAGIGAVATGVSALSKAWEGVKASGFVVGIVEFFKAAKQNAPDVGWFAALLPKLSTALAGLPAAFSSAASALAVAGPWIAVAAAVVGGITLAFVEYDFTDLGYKIGYKIGEALRNTAAWIGDVASAIGNGIKTAFEWAVDALDIDDIWDVLAVLFVPGELIKRITPELATLFTDIGDAINEKLVNLRGNVDEFFGGFFKGLFEGLGFDMSWTEKFTEIFDIQYTDILEATVSPFTLGKHIVEGIWEGVTSLSIVEKFKTWCNDIIAKVKEVFDINSPSKVFADIGKELIAGLVSVLLPDTIKNAIVSMWNNAKTWWDNNKPSLKTYTPSIGDIKSKVSSAWTTARDWYNEKKKGFFQYTPSIGSIYEKAKVRWDNAREWYNEKKKGFSQYTPSIGSIYEKAKVRWDNAREWYNEKKKGFKQYTPSIGSIKDKVVSAFNSAKKWWNSNASLKSLSTKLNVSVPKIEVKWKTAEAFGKSFKYPTGFNLKFAANGGIFDQGSLIWAGERGPEVMATAAGGKTGVMNIEQMQEAVYEGVYAAITAAMGGKSEGGAQAVNVYLDGRQITAAVEQRQRERGASIMGNEVYSY